MKQELTIEKFAHMVGGQPVWLKRLSFASILVSSNMLQTMFTNTLDGFTSKQWLLLTIASSMGEPQTLSELGKVMGCSRQNVKQITEILKRKGFVEYCKLEGDKNTIRIQPTSKWNEYCKKNDEAQAIILEQIFEGFTDQEIQSFFQSFCKIMKNMEKVNDKPVS